MAEYGRCLQCRRPLRGYDFRCDVCGEGVARLLLPGDGVAPRRRWGRAVLTLVIAAGAAAILWRWAA